MLRLTASSALLTSMLFAATALAAPPEIPVTTCGQVLPARAHGVLASDLDCTGEPVGVVLGRAAKLSLGGFTLANGFNGVQCDGSCTVTGPGTITGSQAGILGAKKAKVSGVTISSMAVYGIDAPAIELEDSTVSDVAFFAVQGQRSVRMESSSITASFGGLSVERAVVKGSTIAASQFGMSGTFLSLKDGSAIDMSGGAVDAYAIRTVKRPHLSSDATCTGRSLSLGPLVPSWGVCSLD